MLLDQAHREFFWLLVRRDLKVRYAGSTLGGFWNLIHPLMMIAIYMTIFSSIMANRMGGGGAASGLRDYGDLNYGVHLVAGLIPWLVFSEVLMRSVGVLIENANFLKKVAFPPLVLFGSVLFNSLLVNGVGYLVFMALLGVMGEPPPASAWAGLGVMALLGVAATGLGLILAGLNVFFRDTGQALAVLLQLLFWFNPIVYQKELILSDAVLGDRLAPLKEIGRWIMLFNPIERFITASQSLFGVIQNPPGALDWTIVGIFPVACLAAGLWLFKRMLPDARDCL